MKLNWMLVAGSLFFVLAVFAIAVLDGANRAEYGSLDGQKFVAAKAAS